MAEVQFSQPGQGGDGVRESLQLIVMKIQNLEPEKVGNLNYEHRCDMRARHSHYSDLHFTLLKPQTIPSKKNIIFDDLQVVKVVPKMLN